MEVPRWDFFRGITCKDTYFAEEQSDFLKLSLLMPSNWMICSGKDSPQLKKLIEGVTTTQNGEGMKLLGE